MPSPFKLAEEAAQGDRLSRRALVIQYSEETADELISAKEEALKESQFYNALQVARKLTLDDDDVISDFNKEDTRRFIEGYPWDDGTTEQMLEVLDNWDVVNLDVKWAFSYTLVSAQQHVKDLFGTA